MSSLSAIASYNICSSMRQKVGWSLIKGGHLREIPEFFWWREATTRNMSAFAGYRANRVEKFGGFRIGRHLYKAVTYNIVIHIFKGSPYFQVSSGVEIC